MDRYSSHIRPRRRAHYSCTHCLYHLTSSIVCFNFFDRWPPIHRHRIEMQRMRLMRRLLQLCPPHKQLRKHGGRRLWMLKKCGRRRTQTCKSNITILEDQHQRCNWSVYAHLPGEGGYENSGNFVDNHDRTQLYRNLFVVPGNFSRVFSNAVFIRLSREHLYKKESEPIFL